MSSLEQRLRSPSATATRLADFAPGSYDAQAHTVKATLSVGAPVKRPYGTEILKISSGAINLDRVSRVGVPLIDSHNILNLAGVLGRLDRAWFERGQLVGLIRFDDGDAGRKAEGLVARGTIRGVSIGYRVDDWEITDEDGNVVDPETQRMRFDDNYTFTAKRWELLEVSLVSVPADPSAIIRSAAGAGSLPSELSRSLADIMGWAKSLPAGSYEFRVPSAATRANHAARARMMARANMAARQALIEYL